MGALGGWALTRAHYTSYSDYASPSVEVPVTITNNNNPVITASASGTADATNTNNDDDTIENTASNTNTAENNGKRRKRSDRVYDIFHMFEVLKREKYNCKSISTRFEKKKFSKKCINANASTDNVKRRKHSNNI